MNSYRLLSSTKKIADALLIVCSTLLVIEFWRLYSSGFALSSVSVILVSILFVLSLAVSSKNRSLIKQSDSLSKALDKAIKSESPLLEFEPGYEPQPGGLGTLVNELAERIEKSNRNSIEARNYFEEKVIAQSTELSELRNEQKRVERKLVLAKQDAETATRNKGQFLANMSHEIRTPMNGVLGMIELLLGTELNPKQLRFANTVRRSAEGLLSIINDILDFSRIESGKITLEHVDFGVRATVEDVTELLSESAHKKGIELLCHIDEGVSNRVQGDPGRLRQVLTNIIGNAIKFTNTGEVVVRVVQEEQNDGDIQFSFTVTDTGTGIAPEMKRRIFESFSQADTSSTRQFGGTGLGLTISKELVSLMGGTISLDSTLGKGSKFEFTCQFAKPTHEEDDLGINKMGVKGFRILSVDDNNTNLSILHHQLSSWGIENQSAQNGFDALEKLHEAAKSGRPFDAAILDMHMPIMDGLELARKIKAEPEIASVKLMMLTSAVLDLDIQQMHNIGILQYLSKPARQSQLYNCLLGMLGSRLADQQDESATLYHDPDNPPKLGARILVAEDNPVNQEVVLSMLDLFGCQAQLVEDGQAALEAFCNSGPYDLILMDCQMPLKDGYDATSEIRKIEQERGSQQSIPVIALTANALEGDRERCLIAGMNDYLSKPFKQDHLLQCLGRWLQDSDSSGDKEKAHAEQAVSSIETIEKQIDEAALDAIRSLQQPDKPSILGKIVNIYLNNSPKSISKLRESIENDRPDEVRAEAHSLKSSSANLGAKKLASHFKDIEQMGRDQTIEGAMEILQEVERSFEKVMEELEPYVQDRA